MVDEFDYRTPQEVERAMCREYELEFYEKQSLYEIERMLSLRMYRDSETIQKHIEFLEHLHLKLHSIREAEIKEGFSTFELDRAVVKIKQLSKQLMDTLYLIDGDLRLSLSLPTHKFKYA
jgi:hypothetical protein